LDFFAYGGSDSAITFFNGTDNNNSAVEAFNLSASAQGSDFSNDGAYLVVGLSDGNVYVYTQNCQGRCAISAFYNANTNNC
jgi:hypothetical protein